MSTEHTAEESKNEYIDQMGEPLGKLYNALWQELAWLYRKWGEYVVLFGTKQSRIELMNKAASSFFRIIQDSLWEDTILHIARLTDKPKTFGKSNLSIQSISELLIDDQLKNEVDLLIHEAIMKSEFCRDWRNRRIAHRDLKLAIEEGINPLMPANREKVKEALKAISDILNALSHYYLQSSTMFEISSGKTGSAISLLHLIRDGLKAEEERIERHKRREFTEEDFGPREL